MYRYDIWYVQGRVLNIQVENGDTGRDVSPGIDSSPDQEVDELLILTFLNLLLRGWNLWEEVVPIHQTQKQGVKNWDTLTSPRPKYSTILW